MLTVKCGCGCETKAQAPDGVNAPVQYGHRIMGAGIYLWHGQFLSRDRACQALSDLFGCAPSPGALAAAARKTAAFLAPALAAITRRLIACEVAHFDETGFRTAGKLAWVHSASQGKFALFTVHAKRGKDGMKAAGVLPHFRGIAVHDAWAPYDTFDNVAGHALCGAHVLRELVAVTETGTDLDRTWAQQAIDALLALNEAADAARAAGQDAIDPETRTKHEDWYRQAAATGIALNAARQGKLQQKRHALATRMKTREADYLRFARDLRVPFTNNAGRAGHPHEQTTDQDLRLHALHGRSGRILRDPLLPRHRRPARHRRTRRAHHRIPRPSLDSPNRITSPAPKRRPARARIAANLSSYPF